MKNQNWLIIVVLALALAAWWVVRNAKSAAALSPALDEWDGHSTIVVAGVTYKFSQDESGIWVLLNDTTGRQKVTWVLVSNLDRWLPPISHWEAA
jgi:hypothetical protein